VLDDRVLHDLGEWDIVYSWGVLHHTGNMWQALTNVTPLVKNGGRLCVAIYNDQGRASRFWKHVKLFYNKGRFARGLVLALYVPYFVLGALAVDLLRLQNPLRRYLESPRGMSILYDWLDWLGGYPFQVARPEQVFEFYRAKGFVLERLTTCGGKSGCNEFLFIRP
jgi:2-polyprenyl-6-hydroxyphenyl methylase/3-demethylubiquinone-9 3-methyltransferase